MDKPKSFSELIDHYLKQLPNMSKEEADFIESVIRLPDENKNAFMLAKRIFEDKND